jgi:hypothetical protein
LDVIPGGRWAEKSIFQKSAHQNTTTGYYHGHKKWGKITHRRSPLAAFSGQSMTTRINSAPSRLTTVFFKTSAPAMIFGNDIVENAEILVELVDNIEIVLFHTPTQNNFLSRSDLHRLAQIGSTSFSSRWHSHGHRTG